MVIYEFLFLARYYTAPPAVRNTNDAVRRLSGRTFTLYRRVGTIKT